MGNKLQEQKEKVEIQLLKFKIGFLHLGNRLEIWTLLKKKKKNERISFDSDWIYKNLGLVSWTSEILLKFTFTFNTETQRLLLSDKIKIWHRKLKKKRQLLLVLEDPENREIKEVESTHHFEHLLLDLGQEEEI